MSEVLALLKRSLEEKWTPDMEWCEWNDFCHFCFEYEMECGNCGCPPNICTGRFNSYNVKNLLSIISILDAYDDLKSHWPRLLFDARALFQKEIHKLEAEL